MTTDGDRAISLPALETAPGAVMTTTKIRLLAHVLARLLHERATSQEMAGLIDKFDDAERAVASRVAAVAPEQRWEALHDAVDGVRGGQEILEAVCSMWAETRRAFPTSAPAGAHVMEPEAFHGPLGEYVRAIEPHTEADPNAIQVQLLVLFGNVIGRRAHFKHEADVHYTNLFAVIVGPSAKGRKGVALNQAKRLIGGIDAGWKEHCIASGLSSGEGLIHRVRDPLGDDLGALDKRLLVVEPEFASVLKQMRREGNILSPILRDAWDQGTLQTLTKHSPSKATGSLVSVVGHITTDELRRHLTETEMANGFGNRFLWALARRSKLLPEGGRADRIDWAPHLQRFERAFRFASQAGEIQRDASARRLWLDVYPQVSRERPGLFGAITSRAEAQVTRLATIYALTDCSSLIKLEHLEAALAVWQYCEESARIIFGDAIGDLDADKILQQLRVTPAGLTRTEISALFSRNTVSSRIDSALKLLQRHSLAHCVVEDSGGRPVERWIVGSTKETK